MDTPTIENNFNYHRWNEEQTEQYRRIQEKAKELAYLFLHSCPPKTREKALAFTKLEEAVMWANASIARNPN